MRPVKLMCMYTHTHLSTYPNMYMYISQYIDLLKLILISQKYKTYNKNIKCRGEKSPKSIM
jgi:hypothetical protein